MKCLRTVLLAILAVAGGMIVLFGLIGALIWISEVSAQFFGLGGMWGAAFMLGYMTIGIGTSIGVQICRENA